MANVKYIRMVIFYQKMLLSTNPNPDMQKRYHKESKHQPLHSDVTVLDFSFSVCFGSVLEENVLVSVFQPKLTLPAQTEIDMLLQLSAAVELKSHGCLKCGSTTR